MSIKKLEEDVHKSRKENKELKKEIKELKIHNTFLLDRLEQWAERNFQESKSDYTKEKKLAREMEEVHESQFKVDSKGIA